MSDKFRIHYNIDVVLDKKDLWPDGIAPLNPNVGDVLALIRRDGGVLSILDKWSLHAACGEMAVTAIPGDNE